MYIVINVCRKLCFNPGPNKRILHIAQNFSDGHTSKVFDYNLGSTSAVLLNGNYIFAAKSKVKNHLLQLYSYILIIHEDSS